MPRHRLTLIAWLLVFVVISPASAALAADVPIVGVAAGDQSRQKVTQYMRMLSDFEFEIDGYRIIPPRETARQIEAQAPSKRLLVSSQDQLAVIDELIQSGWESIKRRDIPRAVWELEEALAMIEYGEPLRIRLGEEKRWHQARMLLASAYLLEPVHIQGDTTTARAAITPVVVLMKEKGDPEENGYGHRMINLYREVLRDVYMRPHGRVSVRAAAGGVHDVFINGVYSGATPTEAITLPEGPYVIEVGRKDRPSRIHRIDIKRGSNIDLEIDPVFEQNLSTEGYPIYVAPDGQPVSSLSSQAGRNIAKMTGSRYALVIAVDEGDSGKLRVSMVDAEQGVVVREHVSEASDDPQALADALEGTTDGYDSEESESWPFERWMWISAAIVATATTALSIYFFIEGADLDQQADQQLIGSQAGDDLRDDARNCYVLGGTSAVGAAVSIGVFIYYLYQDLNRGESIHRGNVYNEPEGFRLLAAPLLNGQNGETGFELGARWRF